MARTMSTTANQTCKELLPPPVAHSCKTQAICLLTKLPAFPAGNLILEPGLCEFNKLTRQTRFGNLHDALFEDNHERVWTIYSFGTLAITLDKDMIELRLIKPLVVKLNLQGQSSVLWGES